MEIINKALTHPVRQAKQTVEIPVDRLTLAKRRWRGVAVNGKEFGFDLEHPLEDGEWIFDDGGEAYRIAQTPEAVLTVAFGEAAQAARLGWLLGNLHFRIAVTEGGTVQAPDDPAVRQMLEREHFRFRAERAVFRPLGGGHLHGH